MVRTILNSIQRLPELWRVHLAYKRPLQIEALNTAILPVSYTYEALILGKGQAMRQVKCARGRETNAMGHEKCA